MCEKNKKITIQCATCGKSFDKYKKEADKFTNNFCNKQCYYEWMRSNPKNNPNYSGGVYRVCDYCGNGLTYLKPSRNNGLRFCSKQCSDKYHVNDKAPKWAGGKIKKTCSICKKIFYVIKGEIERGAGIYCSKECQSGGRKNGRNVKCSVCGKEIYRSKSQLKNRENIVCSDKCRNIAISGENNRNWSGGKLFCSFDFYADKLILFEEVRRDPNNEMYLQVRCNYCNSWINPTSGEVQRRISYAHGTYSGYGEPRFYCKDTKCKQNCSIFGQQLYPKGYKINSSREVQPELRKMCFERDNWICQKCGSKVNLHCHHTDPVINNPLESADLDNVITLCKDCHKEVHSKVGCRYSDLACRDDLLQVAH